MNNKTTLNSQPDLKNDDKALNYAIRGKYWYGFISVLLCLLITIGFINYIIDPYGHYGTNVLKLGRVDSRIGIIQKLNKQTLPPQLLLFGSSRVLKQSPNYHPEIHGVNVSVFAGAIEDHYSILRYAVDELKYPIKFAVIGLEADLMPGSHPINGFLSRSKKLNRWLIQKQFPTLDSLVIQEQSSTIQSFLGKPSYIKELSSLLSIITLGDSLKKIGKYFLIKRKISGSKKLSLKASDNESTNSLLAFIFNIIEAERQSMQARLRQYKTIYAGNPQVEPLRLQYLYKFAEFARERGIHVIAFKPGYSIGFWQEMNKISGFRKISRELDIHEKKIKKQFGWKFIDFRPTSWNGEEIDFPDGVHPSKRSISIIDNAIKEMLSNAI